MRDFNQNNRSGGRSGGGWFGGRDSGRRSFGGRDSAERTMHKAICAECGNECEVPFRPSGDRPVYCSNCFEKRSNEDGNSRRSSDREFQRPRFEQRPQQGEGNNRGNANPQHNSQVLEQLSNLNAKLDKIMSVLEPKIAPQAVESQNLKPKAIKAPAKKKKVTKEEIVKESAPKPSDSSTE